MSNRRVKSLAADDDFDGYDEEDEYEEGGDEVTADDKEQLRLGTVKVREALGPAFPASDTEIQESLWHYYYDIAKTVAYLKNKRKPPAPKTKDTQPPAAKAKLLPSASSIASAKDFFADCPWLQIPVHRQSTILIEPVYQGGGLLGGSSKEPKMSKLAALAAKRRQQAVQKPGVQPDRVSAEAINNDYVTSLGKLKVSQSTSKPSQKDMEAEANRGSSTTHGPMEVSQKDPSSPPTQPGDFQPQNIIEEVAEVDLHATPSPFAQIMLGSTHEAGTPIPAGVYSQPPFDTPAFDFSKPSPDDVVFRAQTAKATTTTTTTTTTSSKPNKQAEPQKSTKKDVSSGVAKLSIQDSEPPAPKSQNIDVVAEYKKVKRKNAANFVVIGHVDAGKSTLMGRLLFDLKAIDQRTMTKYQQEADRIGKGSFAFAWVLDSGTEERQRGVTIDIATNKFSTSKTDFTILDAPGHRDFVPNMIAGAAQADFAVLVIDASPGNFESGLKGQTKEHALLVRSIGVQRVIIAVNKMDAAEWSEARFEEIRQQMSSFLTTAGFQAKNLSFIPCSGLNGDNILTRSSTNAASWYTGQTLVESLDSSEPNTYALDKPLRMTINDVFRGGVQNPLSISGRIESGTVQTGEPIVIMPSSEQASIKSIEVDDEPQNWAVAGQNVVLNLTDIDPIHIKTGDVICPPSNPIRNVTCFTAKVLAFEHLTPTYLDVHRGRLHVPGRITQLVAVLDKASGEVVKKKPKIVKPGSVVRVVVELESAVPLESSARVVLRSQGSTVAAGLIE